MNPIEIEEQLSKLASEPFDVAEFPFQFLECYGRKAGEITVSYTHLTLPTKRIV